MTLCTQRDCIGQSLHCKTLIGVAGVLMPAAKVVAGCLPCAGVEYFASESMWWMFMTILICRTASAG